MTATYKDCGARRPGWGVGLGRHRLPCVLVAGHGGHHRDGLTAMWEAEPTDSDDTEDAVMPEQPEPYPFADGLYDVLSDALKARGSSERERADNQRAADDAFTALDSFLRNGGALPSPWAKHRG